MGLRETLILLGCAGTLLFFACLSIYLTTRAKGEINLEYIVNGHPSMSKRDLRKEAKEKINNSTLYQQKYAKIQKLLDDTYDIEQTPESIIKFEIIALFGGLGITLLVHIIFNILILTLISLGLTIYATLMKEMDLKNKYKRKLKGFDDALPQFEVNMLLGMQAGASIQKAMEMAIKTLPKGLVQVEFKKLLLESNTNADDIAIPYLNLSKRVPTKDCERFCNIVISGIRNGNSMTEILTNESEYMSQQVLNKIREQGEKNSVQATAVSTGLVFLPLLIIFLAPIMASTSM